MKFKRILCGVDFLPVSVKAFETALELAQSFQAALHIMHVIEVHPVVPMPPGVSTEDSTLALEEKAGDAMETLIRRAEKILDGPPLTTEITRGRAYVELLNRAREFEADLIVLGAKGFPWPEEVIGGGAAEHVFKIASCSVLIVKEDLNSEYY
ncbi:MAG: universal stress protein [Acidobacteria bacterium]|nr:universal stress protein [Acidobacteriota bacterium]